MGVNYVQVDSSPTFDVGCSGVAAGPTTRGFSAVVGVPPGSNPITIDTGNNVTRAVLNFHCGALAPPGVASWAAGNYVIPINFSTGDAGTTVAAVYVCDYDGTNYQTVASSTGRSDATTGGVVTVTINRATAYTPLSQANSRPFIVVVLTNATPTVAHPSRSRRTRRYRPPLWPRPAPSRWRRLLQPSRSPRPRPRSARPMTRQ